MFLTALSCNIFLTNIFSTTQVNAALSILHVNTPPSSFFVVLALLLLLELLVLAPLLLLELRPFELLLRFALSRFAAFNFRCIMARRLRRLVNRIPRNMNREPTRQSVPIAYFALLAIFKLVIVWEAL